MKVCFIYYFPHPMHKAWADSITDKQFPFVSFCNVDKIRKLPPLIHQILSMFTSFKIPKSDIYLLENIACLLPVLIRKKKDSKIILMNCDNFFYDLQYAKGLKKKVLMWYVRQINGIISNSEYIKKISQKFTKAPNLVVNPGINKKFFNVNADYNSRNIAHGISLLRKQKGTDLVIEAFRKIKNYRLYLIGPVGDIKIPKDEKIIVTGFTDHPEKYLKKCSIYINPARFESFGMNIVEAMAAGLAPIVSENCGAKDIVAKVSPRLVIKSKINEIIKTVNYLNQENRKEVLGKKAKEVAKWHIIDKSIKNFKNSFNNLIKRMKK